MTYKGNTNSSGYDIKYIKISRYTKRRHAQFLVNGSKMKQLFGHVKFNFEKL